MQKGHILHFTTASLKLPFELWMFRFFPHYHSKSKRAMELCNKIVAKIHQKLVTIAPHKHTQVLNTIHSIGHDQRFAFCSDS